MANYVLTYKGGDPPPASEAERRAIMQEWVAWFDAIGAAVVDAGNPFGPAAAVAPDGSVSEGAPSGLTGYTVVTAESLAAAVELAKGCPHLGANGTVEVYETFEVM